MPDAELLASPEDFTKAVIWLEYFKRHGCMKCDTKENYGGCGYCESCLRQIDSRLRSL